MTATSLEYIEQSTATNLLTTEMNSLTTGSRTSAGSAINNVQATSNLNGYPYGSVQFLMAAYTGTPSAGAALYVWFLKSIDGGSTYEDTTSARAPDVIIPIGAVATGPQKITIQNVQLPVGFFKAVAQNFGTGLTFASSGNILNVLPNTYQGV